MVRPLSYLFGEGGGGRAGGLWGGMGGHFIFRRIEGGIIRICEPKKDIINEEELELRIQKDDKYQCMFIWIFRLLRQGIF